MHRRRWATGCWQTRSTHDSHLASGAIAPLPSSFLDARLRPTTRACDRRVCRQPGDGLRAAHSAANHLLLHHRHRGDAPRPGLEFFSLGADTIGGAQQLGRHVYVGVPRMARVSARTRPPLPWAPEQARSETAPLLAEGLNDLDRGIRGPDLPELLPEPSAYIADHLRCPSRRSWRIHRHGSGLWTSVTSVLRGLRVGSSKPRHHGPSCHPAGGEDPRRGPRRHRPPAWGLSRLFEFPLAEHDPEHRRRAEYDAGLFYDVAASGFVGLERGTGPMILARDGPWQPLRDAIVGSLVQ